LEGERQKGLHDRPKRRVGGGGELSSIRLRAQGELRNLSASEKKRQKSLVDSCPEERGEERTVSLGGTEGTKKRKRALNDRKGIPFKKGKSF